LNVSILYKNDYLIKKTGKIYEYTNISSHSFAKGVINMKRILLIEDDENLSRGIAFSFEKNGYLVITANSIMQGKQLFDQQTSDLIILDLGLPDGNGMNLCKEIRSYSDIPIIMLTACDLETDEVQGLMSGADDYITKPFSLSILRARVETLFRRLETNQNFIIQSGMFKLDLNLCKFYRAEDEIPISTTEFRLLKYFMSNTGQILTKEQILTLWDVQGNFVDENTISVNISRLRAKIENDPKHPKTLKTLHGMGYVWIKE